MDAGEADRAAGLWAVDGTYDVGDWFMTGRDEVAAMVRSDDHQGLIARGCCHFFGPPVVTVGGDEATVLCESTLLVRRDAGGYAGADSQRLPRLEPFARFVTQPAGLRTRVFVIEQIGDAHGG